DTGSLALGTAMVATAITTGFLWYLPLLALVFTVETVSVIAQVASFKMTGKRIIRMSPLHNHFIVAGWRETPLALWFWTGSLVAAARQRGIEITSEIDLFFRSCSPRIAGITGTNGKATTTALTTEMLRAGDRRVMRGGNIGEPVLDRLDQLRPDDWVFLELSSFQLESISRPRLRIGVVLNVTPDHLDRHKYFEHYVEIKTRAVAFMEPDDRAILN